MTVAERVRLFLGIAVYMKIDRGRSPEMDPHIARPLLIIKISRKRWGISVLNLLHQKPPSSK